ncbi:MAG: hypothetical protein ACRDN6_13085 [Gaiellaceae bacterium]
MIKRELEEIGPVALEEPAEWWKYLPKRFVHEEFFKRRNIPVNRDFLLSLNATVVYHVSQLWIAFDKRDSTQWLWHMGELTKGKVRSDRLATAFKRWKHLIEHSTLPQEGEAVAETTASSRRRWRRLVG